jgi:hypothetical protein
LSAGASLSSWVSSVAARRSYPSRLMPPSEEWRRRGWPAGTRRCHVGPVRTPADLASRRFVRSFGSARVRCRSLARPEAAANRRFERTRPNGCERPPLPCRRSWVRVPSSALGNPLETAVFLRRDVSNGGGGSPWSAFGQLSRPDEPYRGAGVRAYVPASPHEATCRRCRAEIRDGREYRVTLLPEQKPSKERSRKTRYRMADVGKAGDTGSRKKRKRRGAHAKR